MVAAAMVAAWAAEMVVAKAEATGAAERAGEREEVEMVAVTAAAEMAEVGTEVVG